MKATIDIPQFVVDRLRKSGIRDVNIPEVFVAYLDDLIGFDSICSESKFLGWIDDNEDMIITEFNNS